MTQGELLKYLLKDQDKTQHWLAVKTKVTDAAICQYCNNSRRPNSITLYNICKMLDITVEKFVEDSNDLRLKGGGNNGDT